MAIELVHGGYDSYGLFEVRLRAFRCELTAEVARRNAHEVAQGLTKMQRDKPGHHALLGLG